MVLSTGAIALYVAAKAAAGRRPPAAAPPSEAPPAAAAQKRRGARDSLGLRVIVDAVWFRTLVVTVIFASTVATAIDGPFATAEFGQAHVEATLRMLNVFFGARG